MNNQGLFIIQIVFAFFFVWWLWSKRRGLPRPTILNLEKDLEIQRQLRNVDRQPQQERPVRDLNVYQKSTNTAYQLEQQISIESSSKSSLNVIFMWNGYGWDAFEVFGLAAGSSLELVTIKYQEMLITSDEGQRKFLNEAYNAIVIKYK